MPLRSPKPSFSLNPLLWLAASFAVGIVLVHFLHVAIVIPATVAIAAAALSIVFRGRSVSTIFILLTFFAIGVSVAKLEQENVEPNRIRRLFDEGHWKSGELIEIEGTLSGVPEPAPEGYFLVIRSSRAVVDAPETKVSGLIRLFVPVQTDEAKADFAGIALTHGSRVRFACSLEREERYLNPGVYSRIALLDRQGIDATANLKSPLLLEKIADAGPVDQMIDMLFELRIALIEKFREMFRPQTAGVLIASMLGNKYFLDKQTADAFREGGTFHVLVISGLHITFIGGLILLLMRRFTRRRWLQASTTLTVLWFYGVAVGGDVPVVRACVMFTILMIGYAEFRTTSLLNSLGASALLLLAWRPSDLFDPSLQLTFVSVGAIVAAGLPLIAKLQSIGNWMPSPEEPFPPTVPVWLRRFCETIYWNNDAWRIYRSRQIWKAEITKAPWFFRLGDFGLRRTIIFIFEGVVISTVVQICLLPLLVYYFHRFPLVSIPMNLWVGGVLASESISAVLALAISTVSNTFAFPLVALSELCNWMIVTLPSFLTTSVLSNSRFPIYTGAFRAIYLIYFIPLIVSTIFLLRWDPFAMKKTTSNGVVRIVGIAAPIVLFVLSSVILLHPFSAPASDGKLHFDFLDVGQGDATLVTLPNGNVMLIDAGGKLDFRSLGEDKSEFEPDVPRIGETVVSEFLWERGISRVDMIVATHADADHIQGLSDVVRNFSVGNAYLGRIDDEAELKPLLAELDRFGIDRSIVHAGESLQIAGVRIDVLNPILENSSANNGSVVLKFTFGENSFLFTGDIEAQAEMLMLQAGEDLHSDVIKVPHHGSKSSSTEAFANAVHPQFAIISVGRRSTFGHPHNEVVDRWKAIGAEVMTTGERGMISVVSDGKEISVRRYLDQ
jgi:competence protein ComEC